MKKFIACSLMAALLLPLSPAAAQDKGGKESAVQPAAAAKKSPYAKLAEPFPDAEQLARRRSQSMGLPLFAAAEPLAIELSSDFKAVNRDRTEKSLKRFDAKLSVAGGAPIPIKLGTRGHFRLRQVSCGWVPLRVEFPKDGLAGTVFDGQKALKLVTHCRDNSDYEQFVLQEYLIYRVFNLLTPRSFRARLTKVTYVDASTGKPQTTRFGMFIEDDDDVARRADSRSVEIPNVLFKDLDQESLTMMALFEFMIGNTDYSILRLHNVRLMQDPARKLYPVPYDFDFSGLVDTTYAIPDKRLGITSVRERLYRGPCRTEEELAPVVDHFRSKRDEIIKLYDSLPELGTGGRKQARGYIEEFYSLLEKKDRAKRLGETCNKSGM
jgi:hypothetical protein